jgi:hypothetical protein
VVVGGTVVDDDVPAGADVRGTAADGIPEVSDAMRALR